MQKAVATTVYLQRTFSMTLLKMFRNTFANVYVHTTLQRKRLAKQKSRDYSLLDTAPQRTERIESR